jgi:pimeloyl-ACP methyl ester carboxylesterase
MSAERLEIPVEGATLVADRWAGTDTAVVLLHAGVCDRRCWREVGDRLAAEGMHVLAYDRRGFGEVPPAAQAFRHVDDLLAVLDAVSPGAPALVVGSSMGGGVALDAALEAPGRVAGLVLLAPAVSGDPEPDEEAVVAETGGLAEAIDTAWTAGDLEACNQLEVRLWLDGPAAPEGRVGGPPRALALAMNRIVLANDAEAEHEGASGLDAAGRLREIAVPATVACGDLDLPSKVRRATELAGALPGGAYSTLVGRAHLPYLEAPGEVAALITSAARRRSGGSPC